MGKLTIDRPALAARRHRAVTIDTLAALMRKPTAAPLVEPAEAIAIALSLVRWAPGRLHSPDDRAVQLILKALKDAGWKIEPR